MSIELIMAKEQSNNTENNATKQPLKKECQKEIDQDLDELRKKYTSRRNQTPTNSEEIRTKIVLINYLTAELANTKTELTLLREQLRKSR